MTIFRLQRAFSSKGKENYEKAKKELEKLDYEELDKKGLKHFKHAIGHGAGTALDLTASGALIGALSKKDPTSKLLKSKAGRIALGTVAVGEGILAGAHAKGAISNAKMSRAVKKEKRRRAREDKN